MQLHLMMDLKIIIVLQLLFSKGLIHSNFYVSTDIIENKTITWTDQIEYCLEVVDSGTIKLPWEENELSFFDTKSKIALMENLRGYLKKNLDVDPKV